MLIDKEEIIFNIYNKELNSTSSKVKQNHLEITKYKTKVNITNISTNYIAIRVYY